MPHAPPPVPSSAPRPYPARPPPPCAAPPAPPHPVHPRARHPTPAARTPVPTTSVASDTRGKAQSGGETRVGPAGRLLSGLPSSRDRRWGAPRGVEKYQTGFRGGAPQPQVDCKNLHGQKTLCKGAVVGPVHTVTSTEVPGRPEGKPTPTDGARPWTGRLKGRTTGALPWGRGPSSVSTPQLPDRTVHQG